MENLFCLAESVLFENDINKKIEMTNDLLKKWQNKEVVLKKQSAVKYCYQPGRPEKPELVLPRELKQRKINTPEGHAAMLHAIAHIEFNAINLALDAVYRFQEMPEEYYGDWIRIAVEEAKHFKLLQDYLKDLNYDYGSFPAHNGLWCMAQSTSHDVLCRMALIPRVMEARGLDVTPGIKQNFKLVGDSRAVDILNIIERDEIGHVAAGNHWYYYLCEQRDLDPIKVFKTLIKQYALQNIKGPIAVESRKKAGFKAIELDWLVSLTTTD